MCERAIVKVIGRPFWWIVFQVPSYSPWKIDIQNDGDMCEDPAYCVGMAVHLPVEHFMF
jgi:hypothetical protein